MQDASNPSSEDDYFLRLPQVLAKTGLSRSALFRMAAKGDFPRPLKIGARASAWSHAEISRWMAARLASRPIFSR